MDRSGMQASGRLGPAARAITLAFAMVALAACGDGSAGRADTAAGTVATMADSTAAAAGAGGTASAGSGEMLYTRCVTCHQANGEGLAGAYPPLAGSDWVSGDPAIPIRVVLHGLQGPIIVNGQSYNAVMPAYGTGQPMTDDEVAAVVSYVRASFGNGAAGVTAADVAREREATATRSTPWTAEELRGGGGR